MGKSEIENAELREKLDTLGRSTKEEVNQEPRKQGLKLIVISGKTFGMTREGTEKMRTISVAGHQVVKNLSEPSEIKLKRLELYADTFNIKTPN